MLTGRKRIAAILCKRDGCTEAEAMERINATLWLINEIGYESCEDVEDIIASELGLEMDYIFDLLY